LKLLAQLSRRIARVWRRPTLTFFGLSLLFAAVSGQCAHAQQCVQLSGTTYTQSFNTLAVSGASSSLPTGFAFSEAGSGNSTYEANDGFNATGNTYSFGTSTNPDRALGEVTTGTVQSKIGACFLNNTDSAIMSALVSYTGEQWRLGTTGGPVDRFDFQFSTDATSLNDGTWINVDGLDFSTPNNISPPGALDGNGAGNRTVFSPTALNPATPVAAGKTFFIRWLPSNITGANDGLAIDDFLLGYVPPPGLSGDFNSNSEIDAADYVIWRKKFGPGTLPNDAGISPGVIDAADFAHWKKRFGISTIPFTGSGSGREVVSGNVPEPASAVFLVTGVCVLVLTLRFRTSLKRRRNGPLMDDPALCLLHGEIWLTDSVRRCR
jgi:hypothetical protein